MKKLLLGVLCFVCILPAFGQEFDTRVPIKNRGASTYYVDGHIEGFGRASLLVDTGSGYATINEETLAVLKAKGQTRFVKELRGVMADGSQKIVPVYRIGSINLGGNCVINDVEVAVFPSKTRLILGLSALRKVSPFIFSMEEPPSLLLSNCQPTSTALLADPDLSTRALTAMSDTPL